MRYNEVELQSTVGFVDLAGFTSAAERLGSFGAHGTEQLGDLINALFTPVIDIVHDAGGEVGWFAGDAIGVLFDSSVTEAAQAVTALAQARAAIIAMPVFETLAGSLSLGVKVGVATGLITWRSIGENHILPWFGGDPINFSSDAEGHAKPGDLIIHESTAFAAGQYLSGLVEVAPKFYSIDSALASMTGAPVSAQLRWRQSLLHQPPRVARLAVAGQAAFLDEHRAATIIFQRMPDGQHNAAHLAELRLIVNQLGGLLQLATEGDKGASLLAIFGAPTALAEREARAVLCATLMRDLVAGSQLGVASGRVYAGRVGSEARWDYSVIGDRVNTAARLMESAKPDEVLLDLATAEGAGATVQLSEPRTTVLKGRMKPEEVYAVTGIRNRAGSTHLTGGGSAFVGRQAELRQLLGQLDEPGVSLVVGQAGTGKSRLLGQIVDLVSSSPQVMGLQQVDRGRPFGFWQQLLPLVVNGLDGDLGQDLGDTLPSFLADDERLPLLGPILGRALPDTSLTASIAADARMDLLASFVLELLGTGATGRTILVEDLHWADDASLQLLGAIAAGLAGCGLRLVASARPDAAVSALREAPRVDVVELPPLGLDDARLLARHVWRKQLGIEPEQSLVNELAERSGGSPLFCEQLVAFAVASGADPAASSLPDQGIPENLNDLLLARLDSLPADGSTVATLASILQESFTVETLIAAFGLRHSPEMIESGVEVLRDRGVVAGFGSYTFVHSLFAEATHDRLSFQLRSQLHADVLTYLEDELGDDLEGAAVKLAQHAEHTTDDNRKRRYFRWAADQAADRYANDVSTYWYSRLASTLDGVERGEVYVSLGEIESVSGDIAAAEVHLIRAIKDLSQRETIPAELSLARVLVKQGSTGAAFDLLDDIISRAEADKSWSYLHAALDVKADVATMLSDVEKAEQVESHHARLISLLGGDHEISRPIEMLTPLHWIRGDLDRAYREYQIVYERCMAERRLVTAAIYASDLAGLSSLRGNLQGVFDWSGRALNLTDETGDRRLRSLVMASEAGLRSELGDLTGAGLLGRVALGEAVSLADRRAVLVALRAVALSHKEMGQDLLRRSLCIAHSIGDAFLVDQALLDLAEHMAPSNAETAQRILDGLSESELSTKALLSSLRLFELSPKTTALANEQLSLCQGNPAHHAELRARLAAHEMDVAAKSEALGLCLAAYSSFPSVALADAITLLDGSPPLPAELPPAVAFPDRHGDLNALIGEIDVSLDLGDWVQTSDDLVRRWS